MSNFCRKKYRRPIQADRPPSLLLHPHQFCSVVNGLAKLREQVVGLDAVMTAVVPGIAGEPLIIRDLAVNNELHPHL